MNILIVSDSYKGCLSSIQAGNAMQKGTRELFPKAKITVLPVSDGGEGMLDAFKKVTEGDFLSIMAHDPLMRPINTQFLLSKDHSTAYIEIARTAGLTLLNKEEKNPMITSTFGVGETVAAALATGAQKIIMGLGGSSTNDAGTGMAKALGYKFLDANGIALSGTGEMLGNIETIDTSGMNQLLRKVAFTAACDVKAPFCGPQGAACIFAAQKGANKENVQKLDQGMMHFARILFDYTGLEVAEYAGAGAAGGLGGALIALFGAKMESGIDLLLHTQRFQQALSKATFILTGEGCLDSQTSMGKTAWGILQEGQKRNIPVLAVAGKIENIEAVLQTGYAGAESATPLSQQLEIAMKPEVATNNITQATKRLIQKWIDR